MDISGTLRTRLAQACGGYTSPEAAIEQILQELDTAKGRVERMSRSLSEVRRDNTMNEHRIERAEAKLKDAGAANKRLTNANHALKLKFDEEVRSHNKTKQQLKRAETSNARTQQVFMTTMRRSDQRLEVLETEMRRRLPFQSRANPVDVPPEIIFDEGLIAGAIDNIDQGAQQDLDLLHNRISALTARISTNLPEPCISPEQGIDKLFEQLGACEAASADSDARYRDEIAVMRAEMHDLRLENSHAIENMRKWYEYMQTQR